MQSKAREELLKYGIGVDMGKKDFHGCVTKQLRDGQIKVSATKKFRNTRSGHQSFYEWIEKHRKEKTVPYQILIEVTGVYHENLLYYLYDKEMSVCLEMPKKVKRYLQSIGQYSKTDKLDSKGIAGMACERNLKEWVPISANVRKLRAILRHRKSLIKSKMQFSNQLHAIEHSAIDAKEVKRSLKAAIKSLVREIEKVEGKGLTIAQTDEVMYSKAKMIADSVPGLGLLSVLTIVAETNGFEQVNSMKQLQSYAGYDVVENSSGQYVGKTKISKRGNVHLRTATYMPAVSILANKCRPFYGLYERLVKRNGGIKKKAMVAVQRKLLVLVYTLWKKNERFDPEYEVKKQIGKMEAVA